MGGKFFKSALDHCLLSSVQAEYTEISGGGADVIGMGCSWVIEIH